MRTVVIRALLASGALSLLSLFGPPYVYCDQALQLNGVQAWQVHQSVFPNWLISADPRDLSRDQVLWEFWHAPGFPMLMALLVSTGLSMGTAVHVLAVISFMAGCVGWSLWALRFVLPRSIHLTLPFLLPAIRYGNDNLVHFHAASNDLWNPLLTADDASKIDRLVQAEAGQPDDLWYFPEPLLALDLSGRRIFGHPVWTFPVAGENPYRTSQNLRVLALVPRSLTDEIATGTLRQTFPQSSVWIRKNIPKANYVLWIGQLRVR